MRRWWVLCGLLVAILGTNQGQSVAMLEELAARCSRSGARLNGLGGLLADQALGQPPPRHYDSRVHPHQADAAARALPLLAFFPQDERDVLLLGDDASLAPAFDPQTPGPLWWAIARDEQIIAQGTCREGRCSDAPRFSAAELGAPGDALRLPGGTGQMMGTGCAWAYEALAVRQAGGAVRLLPPAIEPLWTPPSFSQRPPLWGWIVPLSPTCGQIIPLGQSLPLAARVAPRSATRLQAWLSAPDGTVARLEVDSADAWRFDQAGLWRIHWRADLPTLSPSERLTLETLGAADGCALVVVDDEPLSSPSSAGALSQPLPLLADVPPGWTETRALVSVRAPFGLLEEAGLNVPSRQARYLYDERALARLWPQLSPDDEVQVTLALRGRDANGALRVRAIAWIIQQGQFRQVAP